MVALFDGFEIWRMMMSRGRRKKRRRRRRKMVEMHCFATQRQTFETFFDEERS